MFIGNQRQRHMLRDFFNKASVVNRFPFNFILIGGVEGVGKSYFIDSSIKKFLGDYSVVDYLFVRDYSTKIGKIHTLKVDVPESKQEIELDDGTVGIDYGARQIIDWLNISSNGKYKIAFIENINRMTISTANSLLKTFEEPNENVLIIATATNLESVLNTIISRAFLIKFQPLNKSDLFNGVDNLYPNLNNSDLEFICDFANGKPGVAIQTVDKYIEQGYQLPEEVILLRDYIGLLGTKKLNPKIEILSKVNTLGLIDNFLESIGHVLTGKGMFTKLEKLQFAYAKIASNVAIDNLLFYLALNI